MAENFMSKELLISLGIPEQIAASFEDGLQGQNTQIDRIYQIGQGLQRQLEIYIKMGVAKRTKWTLDNAMKYSGLAGDQDQSTAILKLATIFIFELRSFLLNDEIVFQLGGTYTDEDNNTVLAEKLLGQREMLKGLRASLSGEAMVLQGELERFSASDKINNSMLNKMWKQVLQATDVSEYQGSGKVAGANKKRILDNKKVFFYQNSNVDLNVWFRFAGKYHQLLTYYARGQNDVSFFNKGWLYEWFKAYTVDPENVYVLQNAFATSKTPLDQMIGQMDNVPGYKGGDYSLGHGKGSAQAKYGNDKIISFTNVLQVIYKINSILQEWKKQNDPQIAADELFNLFTDSTTVDTLQLGIEGTKDRILKILEGAKNYG